MTAPTRDDVVQAYRDLLRREPESEEAILHHMCFGSVEELRRVIGGSAEARGILAGESVRPTREDVLEAFRAILRREPESEETILHHMSFATVGEMRDVLTGSAEAQAIRSEEARRAVAAEPGAAPPPVFGGAAWEDMVARFTSDEPVFANLPPVAELPDRAAPSIRPERLQAAGDIEAWVRRDTAPIPRPEDREGYFDDRHYEYWLSGLELWSITMEALRRHGVARREGYAELGAASGRTIRHFAADRTFARSWAFDINARHVAWVNRFLPGVAGVNISSIPSLPLESGAVDCFAAYSVFTHIESFETAWLAEIRRVLHPGGLAILTFTTDHQLGAMTPEWPMWKPLTGHPRWSADIPAQLHERGRMVFRWQGTRSYTANVVYDRRYLMDLLSRFFDVLEYRHEYPVFQDMVMLRRR
jgi:SAM-dependent methyltransferase